MSKYPLFKNIKANPEFQQIKQTISTNEYESMKLDILKNGCKQPITVWKSFLVDGYKRYEICKILEIECPIQSVRFRMKEEAIIWICKNELQKENLPDGYRKYYVGTLFHSVKTLYEKLYPSQNQFTPAYEKRPHLDHPLVHTSYSGAVVAKETGYSLSTIYKYSVYADNIDQIRQKSSDMAILILTDQLQASHNTISALTDLSPSELFRLKMYIISHRLSKLTTTDIKTSSQKSKISNKSFKKIEPEIKQMPAYDPDSEISSLTLTIPSWISSINRTLNSAPYNNVSEEARNKLFIKLKDLKAAVNTIEYQLRSE
ncbi:MAG: hypothetical protein Q4E53_14235 [Eubacteriales bacterium]|nr:hypothetical protein [Eubacteriales bacterium]